MKDRRNIEEGKRKARGSKKKGEVKEGKGRKKEVKGGQRSPNIYVNEFGPNHFRITRQ